MPPGIGITKADVDSLVAERNIDGLVRCLRKDSTSAEVKDYLAEVISDLLKGKIKFPRRRPPKRLLDWEHRDIARRVVSLNRYHGWDKIGAAVKQAAEEFKCSEQKVWKCLRQFRWLIICQMEKHEYDAMMVAANDAARDAAVAHLKEEHGDREFTDREVSDEIEAQQQAWAEFHPDEG
jgi:hypothetical protein